MGFLTQAARNEDTSDEEENIEELYVRLFSKIGRDFIHKNDLRVILESFANAIGIDVPIDLDSMLEATLRAREYNSLLDQGTMPNTIYQDLI